MWQGRTRHIERPPIAAVNALAAQLAAKGTDLINLGQAVLGLPPPPAALERVRHYLATQEQHHYSPDPGLPEALEAVARFVERSKALSPVSPANLVLTCGANQAFVNALLTVTDPGDEVVFFGPNYFDHVFAIKLAGCVPVEVPLTVKERRFTVDFDAVEKALTPRTRVLVMVSPGNPTGAVPTRTEVVRMCELTAGHGRWLFSDETYDLLTFPPAVHVSPAELGIHDRVVVLGSFSKTFALAAWRVGYTYGPEDFIEESIKVQDALTVCAPVPSQMAVMGALEDVDSFIAPAVAELQRRRDAMLAVAEACPLLEPVIPDGATFVPCRITTGEDSLPFSQRILKLTGIVTVPGSAFGQYGEGWVRLSYGNQPVERIEEAGERLLVISGRSPGG